MLYRVMPGRFLVNYTSDPERVCPKSVGCLLYLQFRVRTPYRMPGSASRLPQDQYWRLAEKYWLDHTGV